MDTLDLLIGRGVKWVSDNLEPETAQPRHIGSVVSFFYYNNESETDYSGYQVLGTLEGVINGDIVVAGEVFTGSQVSKLKVFRKVLS